MIIVKVMDEKLVIFLIPVKYQDDDMRVDTPEPSRVLNEMSFRSISYEIICLICYSELVSKLENDRKSYQSTKVEKDFSGSFDEKGQS